MPPSRPAPALHHSTPASSMQPVNNPNRNNEKRSPSQCRSSGSSTTTIDSTKKLTLQEPIKHPPTQDSTARTSSSETNPRTHETSLPRLRSPPQQDEMKGLPEPVISEDWLTSTESDLLNIDEFKERMARAKHWRERKIELRGLVARLRSEGISRKFEIDIKGIGR